MEPLPDSYVDLLPSDPELLVELGRVAWASARLHAGVRDAINRHHSTPSDKPFEATLGQAIAELEMLAKASTRPDQLSWVSQTGRPASRRRNAVIHAITFTAQDGKQAIGTLDHSPPDRFLAADLRDVTRELIAASMTVPN